MPVGSQGSDFSPPADDSFELYDLRVEVIAGDKPMVCDHPAGAYFDVVGENIIFPDGQDARFPMYPLAALLPLLPAKQRITHPHDYQRSKRCIRWILVARA